MNDIWTENTLEDEIQRNILEYGMAVNSDRALPDAKTGLKPVARRILYDMMDSGYTHNKQHFKSARIVGDTMGRFHPHGDSSIYGALVRLAQNWTLRYPLVDGHGNFGTILGDGAASMRYTEARLTPLAEDGLLSNLKKENVDFVPTHDEVEKEPITLPAIFPNLLCNPNEGIGWAMAGSWAPHNLKEVAKAINDYLDEQEPMLPGPDFPTGGLVINKNDIPNIMRTGHGSVKVRGRYKIEKQKIVFYEIPYGTKVESLMTEIGLACDSDKVTGVLEVKNETEKKKGLRLVIEVKKNENPEKVVQQLFKKTNLQSSFSYNQMALVNKVPQELSLKDAIKVYVDHNIDCICREAQFDMKKISNRLHILEGLLKALEDIDNIIALIKKSSSAVAAKESLIEIYSFTETQAKAILDMKLAKLANLEKIQVAEEKAKLEKEYDVLNALINSPELQKDELKERLNKIVKKYGDERRTELAQIEVPKEEKEIAEVIPEDVVVVTTKSGLIKKVPTSSFRVQRRGGKGIKSNDDAILSVIKTNTIDTMMFFTTKGKMYRTIVDNIPNGTNLTKGVLINDLIKLSNNEKVIAVTSLHRKTTPEFIIFVTKNGIIKKSYLKEYTKTNRNTGIAALKVAKGDEVINIIFQDKEDIILITEQGMSIKFETKSINPIGRIAMGVKGIKLNENDQVIAALPIHKNSDKVAVFSKNGLAKQVELKDFPLQRRGGKGTIVYKPSSQTGVLIGAAMVSDDDNILICGNKSNICFSAKEIPTLGKISNGNIMIKDNVVVSVTKI